MFSKVTTARTSTYSGWDAAGREWKITKRPEGWRLTLNDEDVESFTLLREAKVHAGAVNDGLLRTMAAEIADEQAAAEAQPEAESVPAYRLTVGQRFTLPPFLGGGTYTAAGEPSGEFNTYISATDSEGKVRELYIRDGVYVGLVPADPEPADDDTAATIDAAELAVQQAPEAEGMIHPESLEEMTALYIRPEANYLQRTAYRQPPTRYRDEVVIYRSVMSDGAVIHTQFVTSPGADAVELRWVLHDGGWVRSADV